MKTNLRIKDQNATLNMLKGLFLEAQQKEKNKAKNRAKKRKTNPKSKSLRRRLRNKKNNRKRKKFKNNSLRKQSNIHLNLKMRNLGTRLTLCLNNLKVEMNKVTLKK